MQCEDNIRHQYLEEPILLLLTVIFDIAHTI